MKENKILVILDSLKYKEHEKDLHEKVKTICDPCFYYTDYENRVVKYFHSLKGVGDFLSHISYWIISLMAAARLFFLHRHLYSKKVFINPIVGFFYCFLLSLFGQKDNVYLAGFLFVPKSNRLYFFFRKQLVKFSYKKVKKIFVYSTNEVEVYSRWFPSLTGKIEFIKYGRDYDIFEENEYSSDSIYLASGGVSNRDFNTLIKAMKILEQKIPSLQCKVATRPDTFFTDYQPSNMEFLYNIRVDTFGSFLDKSLFVVLPLKNTPLSAGHMSLLEAMYRGKIVLITDISSVRDYVNEELVFFYKPEDADDLANKISKIFLGFENGEMEEKSNLAKNEYKNTFEFSSFLKRVLTNVKNCQSLQ